MIPGVILIGVILAYLVGGMVVWGVWVVKITTEVLHGVKRNAVTFLGEAGVALGENLDTFDKAPDFASTDGEPASPV